MPPLPDWLQRWNFIERARLERQLWDAFERREDLEALVAACPEGFQRQVWEQTLARIRKIETMMRDRQPGG